MTSTTTTSSFARYQRLFLLEDEGMLHGNKIRGKTNKFWAVTMLTLLTIVSFLLFATISQLLSSYDGSVGPAAAAARRHPLSGTDATLENQQKDNSGLRYLTFGSYDQWGFALKDYKKAYPYLLSPSVRNAGLYVGGPSLGACCTQSMTGSASFDVIVIDFFMHAPQGLFILAQRLRQRFPNALIIFVRRWNPFHIAHHPNGQPKVTDTTTDDRNEEQLDAISFKNKFGFKSFVDPEFQKKLQQGTRPDEWFFVNYDVQDQIIKETVESVNGRLVELPRPPTAYQALIEQTHFLLWFDQSKCLRCLSETGHEVLAQQIRKVVQEEKVSQQAREMRDELGTWGQGDLCKMWYTSGRLEPSFYGKGVKMVRFAEKWGTKFALEFPLKGGSIRVHNPFAIPRILYLTYMTVGSATLTANLYPRVQVYFINQNDKQNNFGESSHDRRAGAILEPTNFKERDGTFFTHSPKTVAVGLVNPGTTLVQLVPLRAKMSKFRLTGASLLGSTEVPFEYTLELEPADDFFR